MPVWLVDLDGVYPLFSVAQFCRRRLPHSTHPEKNAKQLKPGSKTINSFKNESVE